MTDNAGFQREGMAEAKEKEPNNGSRSPIDDNSDKYEIPIDDPPEVEVVGIQPAFAGMPKEVLLHYSRQRGYFWAREILTVIVFLTTLILLSLVIAVIAISPACLEFWQTSPIYQVYPKSFRSSDDSDGYGDLNGIVGKLDYLNNDLGVKVVAINAVYQSGNVENDYEISDFKQIDPAFGTMADMDNLISEVHNRGMKVVIDFVPNHSSDKHEWFLASSNTSHPDHEKYKDYYVWVNARNSSQVPNNWENEVGSGTSWTWNENRQAFYYHAFSSSQPDLNLRSNDVRNELKDILRFWLGKGIDGFRSVGTSYLLEASHLRDNPLKDPTQPASRANIYSDYTNDYEGIHDVVAEWRTILEEYSTEPGVFRFLETQADGDLSSVLRYYGIEEAEEADFPMNSRMVRAEAGDWNAASMMQNILDWMRSMPNGKWPNWALSTHDASRIASRAGPQVALCAAIMSMTLPGTPSVYYGDEIGMTDSGATSSGMLSPMQWSMDANAGFCANCTPWNVVNANYLQGFTVQNESVDDTSILSNYKKLISLRNGMVFQWGHLCVLGTLDGVLVYVRELSGVRSVLILLNFKNQASSTLDLASIHPNIPSEGTVEYFSGSQSSLKSGSTVQFDNVSVPPISGVVISYNPDGMLNEKAAMDGKCFVRLKVCYNNGLQVIQYC